MRTRLKRPRQPRIRIQSYGPSKSARELATYLGIKRIFSRNSKFVGKSTDLIVNWGNVKTPHNSIYLNPLASVATAVNKLATFRALAAANVSIPLFYTSLDQLDPNTKYLARTDVCACSGQGIVVGFPSELPFAPLYTKFIDKIAEFRAIVVNNKVVDFKQKKRKSDWESDRDPHVWNCDQGYVFARGGVVMTPEIESLSIAAMQAVGLNYGALDIIEDADHNYYVLEINTSFGLSGTTIQLVGDAIKELIHETRNR